MQNDYNINLTKKSEKFIKKQDKDTQKRIIKAIIELPNGDIKKLMISYFEFTYSLYRSLKAPFGSLLNS